MGALLGFIIWQSVWINRLLDRHEKAYTAEIKRMHEQMNRLLDHVLGKQPSSTTMPAVSDMVDDAKRQAKLSPAPAAPKDQDQTS